jgi:hypothetical protein
MKTVPFVTRWHSLKWNGAVLVTQLKTGDMHFTSSPVPKFRLCGTLADFYFVFRLTGFFFSGFTNNTRRIRSSNAGSGFQFLDFAFNSMNISKTLASFNHQFRLTGFSIRPTIGKSCNSILRTFLLGRLSFLEDLLP